MRGELIALGRTSQVYSWGTGSIAKVLRPKVPDDWAALEAELTDAVRSRGVPAPEVKEVTVVDGRPAIVFQRIDGPSLWQSMLASPSDASALAGELAAVHRQIQEAGLPDGMPDLVARLSSKIEDVERLQRADRIEGCKLVSSLPRGAALLHGDLHPGNVLLGPNGPVVIDWFDAAIGHPVADIVRSSILMRPLAAKPEPQHLPGATPNLLANVHAAYVSASAEPLQMAHKDLGRWEAVLAAARMAEQTQSDETMLFDLWDRRADPAPSAVLQTELDRYAQSPGDQPSLTDQ